jgi:hypothetical protein
MTVMTVMTAPVTAAGPAAVVVGVAASAVGEREVEEWLDVEEDLAASVVLQVDVQMVGHFCHPMLPTLGHLS